VLRTMTAQPTDHVPARATKPALIRGRAAKPSSAWRAFAKDPDHMEGDIHAQANRSDREWRSSSDHGGQRSAMGTKDPTSGCVDWVDAFCAMI